MISIGGLTCTHVCGYGCRQDGKSTALSLLKLSGLLVDGGYLSRLI